MTAGNGSFFVHVQYSKCYINAISMLYQCHVFPFKIARITFHTTIHGYKRAFSVQIRTHKTIIGHFMQFNAHFRYKMGIFRC